jgi:DNA-directed RNA polymerase specialized sigma subunit
MTRRKNRTYFGGDTEDAIIAYNESTNTLEKSRLYNDHIHPAINKLVENVIHKYKFYHYESTYEDLKHETVVYILDRLEKFSKDKGKAFSYFTIVARNYLIVRSQETYDSIRNRDSLDIVDDQRDLGNEVYVEDKRDMLSDFVREWSAWGIANVEQLFESDRDQRIAEAVFVIFKSCEDLENYNKKALYILIREHANVKTQYITKVINNLKDMFMRMSSVYMQTGIVDWDSYLSKGEDNGKS